MTDHVSKRITLNDIAELSGVSKTTASMILNGQGEQFRIKKETQERVQAVAKQYGYRANVFAKSLKSQRTNIIGLVIPDLTNYGFASTAKALEKLCQENGFQLIIACSDDKPHQEKAAIDRLLDHQIDLLITAPTHQDPRYYKHIRTLTPILQLDRYVLGMDSHYIISNDTPKIAELVTQISQTYQLKEYFYLGGQRNLSPSESRLAGFRQGLQNANLPEQDGWVLHRDYQPQSGYQMMSELVQRLGRLPQAVFTASYTLLEGVLRYLTEQKQMEALLNRQLHLATFDDHHLLNALPFHIHSIQQNHQQIALQVFAMIRQKLQQEATQNCLIDCEIIWRD